MKSKVLKLGLMISLLSACVLDAVNIRLPYPKEMQEKLKKEDQEIILRDSENDTKTEGTQDPITSDTFDELFDLFKTDTILVAGVVTEVEKTSVATTEDDEIVEKIETVTIEPVVNYFWITSLVQYLLNLLPSRPAFLTSNTYEFIKKAYKNPINRNDEGLHSRDHIDRMVAEYQRIYPDRTVTEKYLPFFVDPSNRQPIRSIFIFSIQRTQNKDRSYKYKAIYVNEMSGFIKDNKAVKKLHNDLLENIKLKENLSFGEKMHLKLHLLRKETNVDNAKKLYDELQALLNDNKRVMRDEKFAEIQKELMLVMAEKYFKNKKYNEVLSLFESMMETDTAQGMAAMADAVRVRLGYMSNASKQEQLKGLVLFEKLQQAEKDEKQRIERMIFVSKLLVERFQINEALSYITSFADKDYKEVAQDPAILPYWFEANVLMVRIYFMIADYTKAEFYIARIQSALKSKTDLDPKFVDETQGWLLYWTAMIGVKLGKEFKFTWSNFVQALKKSSNNLQLRALAAYALGSVIFGDFQRKSADNIKIAIKHLNVTQNVLESYLKGDVNDYERFQFETVLADAKNKITFLEQYLQQNQTPVQMPVQQLPEKRGSDTSDDKPLKRKK